MKRFYIPLLIMAAMATVAAAEPADSDDLSAEVDRMLRASAETMRSMFAGLNEQTVMAFAGVSVGGEFEEAEVLEHIARSEGGREIVAASCRKAVAEGDVALRMVAYGILAEVDRESAYSLLPEMYKNLGPDEVLLLASFAGTVLYATPEGSSGAAADELYDLIEQDLRGGDEAARLKAAKLITLMNTDRARELAHVGMENPDPEVRRWCIMSGLYSFYGEGESPTAPAIVVEALDDKDAAVRAYAARQLGMMGTLEPKYVEQLYGLLDDEEVAVRRAAASSVNSLLAYAPADNKEGAAKKLLKKLKGEPDGVTRCYLAQAYGAAVSDPEGEGRYLSDDGYWAFYSGEWNEKEIDDYYEAYDCGSWGG